MSHCSQILFKEGGLSVLTYKLGGGFRRLLFHYSEIIGSSVQGSILNISLRPGSTKTKVAIRVQAVTGIFRS